MKSYRKELWFETKTRRAYINITPQVEECLRESGIKEGLALCNAMHITASVFINDDARLKRQRDPTADVTHLFGFLTEPKADHRAA